MKIAILNDTHFGVRNDSEAFRNYQLKFYNEIFFPYLEKNNIKTLIHLGDVVDRRKFINFQTASIFRKEFFDRLWEQKIDTHIIIGNHDTYFKTTNGVNAIDNLYTSFDGINEPFIYTRPKVVEFDGVPILFMPWICDDTREESMHMLNTAKADLCFGHLEIKGIEMQNGVINEHGNDKADFNRFDRVVSGHFHKHTDDGHIFYCGAQYEMTWSDYQDPKGFHIFDTDTRELSRIENPNLMFKKIIYNDKETNYDDLDITPFDKCFIKLYISNKTDTDMYERLMDRLYNNINLHAIDVIEDPTDIGASVKEDILEQGEDTLTFLGNYIEQVDIDLDKQKLKQFAKELYMEASE